MTINKKPKRKKRKIRIIHILLIPVILFSLHLLIYGPDKSMNQLNQFVSNQAKKEIPPDYIPIYKAAAKEYGIPWTLLAAHHRVETKFSSMNNMVSSVGAEGPMQFMPCTFVGWSYPSCSGLGKGNIPEKDKTNPDVIKKYGGYGVDANGDGKADPWDDEDAIYSAANYLAKNGAADGEISKAVFAYNHSQRYVKEVLYFAKIYKGPN
ncbi:lytic transglycosylase domain-containing protein [Falsibacillus pallidus]|uniref:Transglycosylase protein with SLT domain n=1 Tax=Falsibacillus pallidus TaxID=493781 RepID=A0A370GV72_9BACI|nr:lytic transglycosylase domain-containing protein [Falsibacillus pallidus]RDI45823.1 transglycosylase protein with SLT domain [Falsibacillus pallidus]